MKRIGARGRLHFSIEIGQTKFRRNCGQQLHSKIRIASRLTKSEKTTLMCEFCIQNWTLQLTRRNSLSLKSCVCVLGVTTTTPPATSTSTPSTTSPASTTSGMQLSDHFIANVTFVLIQQKYVF